MAPFKAVWYESIYHCDRRKCQPQQISFSCLCTVGVARIATIFDFYYTIIVKKS